MNDALSFSIVIPTFQRKAVVIAAVQAIQRIDYPGAIELIVVIDGSTDGTAAALAEVTGPVPLRIIEQPNCGAATARNRGAAEARGEVILFLDDDMICQSDILRHHALSHADGDDAVLGHIPLDPASPSSLLSRDVAVWAERRAEALRRGAPLTLFDLLTGQLSIKRDVFAKLGGFDQDTDWRVRSARVDRANDREARGYLGPEPVEPLPPPSAEERLDVPLRDLDEAGRRRLCARHVRDLPPDRYRRGGDLSFCAEGAPRRALGFEECAERFPRCEQTVGQALACRAALAADPCASLDEPGRCDLPRGCIVGLGPLGYQLALQAAHERLAVKP